MITAIRRRKEKVRAKKVKPTPANDALIKSAPTAMAELMREFIDKKEFTSRAKTRLKMKSLLDLVSSDTTYPGIPEVKPQQQFGGGQLAYNQPVMMRNPHGFGQGQMGVGNLWPDNLLTDGVANDVAPIPGANQNDDILGEM